MKYNALLTIVGKQNYANQEPETISLTTEGTVESLPAGGWNISYQESEMTGLEGVTTTFEISGDTVTLNRKGPLNSCMVFQEGNRHESLYQMEFGALLIAVCATKVNYRLDENGGTVDLEYLIDIEQETMGTVTYHLDVKAV